MNPVDKAIWHIEINLASDLVLDDVAAAGGVSRFHLCRAFGYLTGYSVMGDVRARRLTVAAHALAAGAPDILQLALDAAYGSHEAFTRAFRDQFGLTPEQVRTRGALDNLDLLEPIRMDQSQTVTLSPPRIVKRDAFLIAGISRRYGPGPGAGIPAQWQTFGPYIGSVPGQVDHADYGTMCNVDDAGGFDYITAVEVSDLAGIREPLVGMRVPAQTYGVFTHSGHV
ncbi:AraC family transcriptional regulator [soil metagenome]